jgi:beta-lactamase regulating signal transducer with metallopeptidase domain
MTVLGTWPEPLASAASAAGAASAGIHALGDGAVRATVLVVVAWLITRSTRWSAADRHRVWSMTVTCLVALPLLLLAGLRLPTELRGPPIDRLAGTVPSLPRPTGDGVWLLATGWLAGAALTAGWFLAGRSALRRELRAATPERDPAWTALHRELCATLAIRASVPLLRTPSVATPVACGVRRPVVVLPTDTDGWPAELRRAVLLHELEHVRRRDAAAEVVAQVACVLFWFHPAVWFARGRLERECEMACDAATVRRGIAREAYVGRLLELARLERWRATSLPVLGVAGPSQLRLRVAVLLAQPSAPRDGGPATRLVSALAPLLTLLTLAASPLTDASRVAPALPAAAAAPDVVPGAGPASFRDAGAPRVRALFGRD